MENHNVEHNAQTSAPAPANRAVTSSGSPKLLLKCSIILLIILLLLIPLSFIKSLIAERAERQQEVIGEVSSKWGGEQLLTGPVLELPVSYTTRMKDGSEAIYKDLIYVLPSRLKLDGTIIPQERHRSLYKVNLYNARAKLTGDFRDIDWSQVNVDLSRVNWKDARLILGLSDPAGLTQEIFYKTPGSSRLFSAFQESGGMLHEGLVLKNLSQDIFTQPFEIALDFNGNSSLRMAPMANESEVRWTSSYPHPSYTGKFLPRKDSSREQTKGFDATWKTITAHRPFPQVWINKKTDLHENAYGVNLVEPTNHYAQTERVVKYALLFIGLTFGVFFLIETLQKLQLHPLQYILVGLAMVIFYTLLLSFSEYMGFRWAYLIAAMAIILLVSGYIKAIFKKLKIVSGFTAGLLVLYGYVYFLIQLEDMALIFGSVALFILLALIMYFTRKIDWYRINSSVISA